MSFEALAWAAKCNPGSPARKLVLLSLAECASRDGCEAYPSQAAMAEFSSLNRKTIIAALHDLEDSGLISDTGKRVGATGQIKVWKLSLERVPKTEQSQKRNSPKNGTLKGPKNGTRNKSGNQSVDLADAKSKRAREVSKPDGVGDQVWADFIQLRKTKRAPITLTALNGIEREAAKVGWSLEEALAECSTQGWQGFKASWIDKEGRHDKRDGVAKAIDRRLRSDGPARTSGRQLAGEGGSDSQGSAARITFVQ